jgi:hypothetical protein
MEGFSNVLANAATGIFNVTYPQKCKLHTDT